MNPASDQTHCQVVFTQMFAFFDEELDAATSEQIRAHLDACEDCLDRYDAEQAMRQAIRRCCEAPAPATLRARIEILRARIS